MGEWRIEQKYDPAGRFEVNMSSNKIAGTREADLWIGYDEALDDMH
jgi:hypothetical protein